MSRRVPVPKDLWARFRNYAEAGVGTSSLSYRVMQRHPPVPQAFRRAHRPAPLVFEDDALAVAYRAAYPETRAQPQRLRTVSGKPAETRAMQFVRRQRDLMKQEPSLSVKEAFQRVSSEYDKERKLLAVHRRVQAEQAIEDGAPIARTYYERMQDEEVRHLILGREFRHQQQQQQQQHPSSSTNGARGYGSRRQTSRS